MKLCRSVLFPERVGLIKLGLLLGITASLLVAPESFAAKGRGHDRSTIIEAKPGESLVTRYLKDDLGVEDPSAFNVVLKLQKMLDELAPQNSTEAEKREGLLLKYYSEQSAPVIGEALGAFARTAYSNGIVLAPAGWGKTHLIDQLAVLLGFGVYPEYLRSHIGYTDGDAEGGPFQVVRDAFLGNTDLVSINVDLLSRDNTEDGKAFSSEQVRMRTILTQLFDAAKREFKRSGRRTVFVLDEVATLPDLVQATLKKILDETGFRNPNDPAEKFQDVGFAVLAMTTPDEYRQMIKGDSAVERRYQKIVPKEVTPEEAFKIVRAQSDNRWTTLYSLSIEDAAIRFLVRMNRLLNSPPLAMPASVLAATNDLFLWKMRHSQGRHISLQDAQQFFMKKAGLTDVWFEGPNGEPPFATFAARLKERVRGQDATIDKMADRLTAWGRLGFGGEVPVFFLGGSSGSGKDTLFKEANMLLYGHDGRHLMFSIGGTADFGINAIIEGPPLGNHSDQEQPLLIKAMENGANGMILFNEGKDAPSEELEKLKVFVESGEVRPRGKDARVRPLQHPIFIAGQWGEELFAGKTDEESEKIFGSLSQRDIEEYFLNGRDNKTYGAVSRALLDRAKKTGGIFLFRPVAKKYYSDIVKIQVDSIVGQQKARNGIEITVSSRLIDYIAQASIEAGDSTRGLGATSVDFTETALSRAIGLGMPMRNIKVSLDHEKDASGVDHIVVKLDGTDKVWKIEANALRRIKDVCQAALLGQ